MIDDIHTLPSCFRTGDQTPLIIIVQIMRNLVAGLRAHSTLTGATETWNYVHNMIS